ncbi:MAG: cytochrome C, partial [Gammaproteobacteria bacterium]
MATSNKCESCHNIGHWIPIHGVDHGEVRGTCVSCHNGNRAPGKSAHHIPSNNQCENCHTTDSWRTGSFDHSGVTANCSACHNGGIEQGKNSGHIASSERCESCHSPRGWKPVTR